MTVPYSFANATVSIPLSQLDANFNTPITLGNTAIQLGNTVTTLNNMTLANVTISSGNVTITNVSVTTANVTTLNAATVIATTANVTTANITTGNVTTANIVTANITTGNVTNMSSGNVAITGGSINGTTLGASTASTANVTTLTTSSTVTINGGTANGVAYLNGSKVLTTGSALTFDGTTLGVNGGLVADSNLVAQINSPTSSAKFMGFNRDGGYGLLIGYDLGGVDYATIRTVGNYPISFGINNAEAMRLTSTGLGIGTSSPQGQLSLGSAAGGQRGLTLDWTGAGGPYAVASFTADRNTGEVRNFAFTNFFQTWYTNNAERMRLDSSGNLGIGTSSPGAPLEVAKNQNATTAIRIINTDSTSNNSSRTAFQLVDSGGVRASFTYINAGSASGTYIGSGLGGNLNFTSGAGVTNATLDSSGNLGLGASPSSQFSAGRFILTSATSGKAANEIFVADGVDNHRVALFVNDTTGKVGLDTGSTSASYSGLSFFIEGTERAVLDRSGNLGLGVTPSAWASGIKAFQLANTSVFGSSQEINVTSNAYYSASGWKRIAAAAASAYQQNAGAHFWQTAGSSTADSAISFTQAMTLDASGNLVIGDTSASYRLDVKGSTGNGIAYRDGTVTNYLGTTGSNLGYLGTLTNHPVAFLTNATERARITSGGDLLVGTTALLANGNYFAYSPGNTWGVFAHDNGVASGTEYIKFYYNNGQIGSITQNGTTAVAYNTSSDYRLKDNPQPLTGSGAFIDALKPKTWAWKADGSKGVGFIAHEVQEVSPGSVTGEKDGEQMQTMEYGSAEFIANIIAELQSLRARVAQLEAK